MRINKTISLLVAVAGVLAPFQTSAQTVAPPQPAGIQEPRRPIAAPRVNPVIVAGGTASPQVVTILHRLNGLKVFRLLIRSGWYVDAIANIDQDFQIAGEV